MVDNSKLIAVIVSAITAYIETEKPSPPLTAFSESPPERNRWQISRRQDLMKVRIMPARKGDAR